MSVIDLINDGRVAELRHKIEQDRRAERSETLEDVEAGVFYTFKTRRKSGFGRMLGVPGGRS